MEERAGALVKEMTLDEKVSNVGSAAAGSARLGLPAYAWQNEALHGLAGSVGVQFQSPLGANFSAATSFPMPITLSAAFNDDLVEDVATIISTESRAFANSGFAGLDFWTPNINPFRDPRWGRGMETPGEDAYRIQQYVYKLISGFEGGVDAQFKRTLATCKHFAAYDIENGRTANDLKPTAQDMADYYLPMFQTCVRDAKVASVMCAYNSVYGVPACASDYLLKDVLREHWNFKEPYNYVVSDCDAVDNIYDPHHYASSLPAAAADALNAGTDLDCGSTYNYLNESVKSNLTSETILDTSLVRLYSALIKVGYFDQPQEYSSLNWADVNTTKAQSTAYQAAVQGMALLKNDGVLPLKQTLSNVAIIGPWANATEQMQGNYEGTAPFLISPLSIFQVKWTNVRYAQGADIDSQDTSKFADALAAAQASDYIVYLGGIDGSVENEGKDRTSITWPGNQLDLVAQLSKLGKPLVVVQFGGGQVDDTQLLEDDTVRAVLWAGYPGQDGGSAVFDALTGVYPPAGRLPVTQYPATYVDGNSIYDMNLRPSDGIPGRTYAWYTGKPVLPFGHGLHYTKFAVSWASVPNKSFDIQSLLSSAEGYKDLGTFAKFSIKVANQGSLASDYVALLYLSGDGGSSPRPIKQLVSYGRVSSVEAGATKTAELQVTLGSIARADTDGKRYIYPGAYKVAVDNDGKATFEFTLTGEPGLVDSLPVNK